LDLKVDEVLTRGRAGTAQTVKKGKGHKATIGKPQDDRPAAKGKPKFAEGKTKRAQRSKGRSKGKNPRRDK
jgi:hypothetical protein